MKFNEAQQEIWDFIQSLNKSWTQGKELDLLEKYFDNNAVALVGSEKTRIVGKEACASHWKKCSEKKIHSWQEINPMIELYENKFAVVTYEFSISIQKEDEVVDRTNRDSFALIKKDNDWLIVLATV